MDTKKVLKLIPVFLNFKLAIRIWWKNLSKFAMIYVWGLAHIAIPAAIFFALFWLGLETNLGSNAIFIDIFIIIGSLAWFFILYYLIRLTLSLFLLIKHEYLGHEFKIYQESARYFWSYLLLQILFWLTLALWFLVFFIPALIFLVFYILTFFVFFFEGKRGLSAIKRSQRLVKGYWLAVGGRVLFIIFALALFGFVLTKPLSYLQVSGFPAIIIGVVINFIIYFVYPIALLFLYNIYKDLVKIKDDASKN